jgi:choline dehydrogenase
VTLVEAGPDYGPVDDGGWPPELLDATAIPESHDWGYRGASGQGRPMPFERARVIGGCSSHNGCAQCAGWRGDYDAWAADCPGWSAADLAPLFAAVAERMRFRRYRESEIQPLQRAFLEAATAAGLPRTDDLDDLDGGAGCGCPPVNIVGSTRWNAAAAYLDPPRRGGRLRVLGDARVDRLQLRAGRCHGAHVVVGGRETLIRAGETIVCAGAYGSPEILLRSGVGAAGDLAALGISVAVDRQGVGAGLRDQPASELEFAATAELVADLDAFAAAGFMPQEQAIAKLGPAAGGAPYAFHLYPWVAPQPELSEGWMVALPVALLRPRSSGHLRLSSIAADLAEIEHGYLSEPDDLTDLAGALRCVLELAAGEPLARYLGRPLAVPADDDDSSLERFLRGRHRHYYHPTGTCRMGPATDAWAVVDNRCRVHGLEGLRVADASIFPDQPRATTAWPTAAVGERTAQLMLAG